jgi:hypothetical protein
MPARLLYPLRRGVGGGRLGLIRSRLSRGPERASVLGTWGGDAQSPDAPISPMGSSLSHPLCAFFGPRARVGSCPAWGFARARARQ